jgi:Pro-kumamolisin, activation domain/Bacterial Ig-like domain (group 3)
MHQRNRIRYMNTAVALCFLLALTILTAGSRYAQAQTQIPAPDRVNQSTAQSGGAMTLLNHTPAKVLDGTAIRVSHYNPDNMLRLALAVQDSHQAEEDQFIKELTTKGSPNFHKFLTQDQWNERFAPSVEDEQAVVNWAQSVGLTVTYRYPNRVLVDVEGTAGTIEKAFAVTINNYQVGEEVDFSNDRDPAIPGSLFGVLHGVAGLNNIERVRRLGTRYKTVKGADYVAGPVIADGGGAHGVGDPSKVSGGAPTKKEAESTSSETPSDSYGLGCIGSTCIMDPNNIWSSEGYNYNGLQRFSHCCNVHNDTTGSPAVSSIALVGYGAFNFSDVETFFNWYGLEYNFNVWLVDGSAPAVDGEAPLDVEYSGAMSNSTTFSDNGMVPNNAHIYEYEMADGSIGTYEDAFNQIVSQDHAKVVSTSYGGSESLSGAWNTAETGALHTIFNNMVGTGYTLIAASGDNGASDGCGDATQVDYPSSDPDFIAAGGTQLTLTGSGLYQSEIGWQGEFWTNADNNGNGGACANNHGGSTGGVSALFTAPSWQPSSILSPTYLWQGGDSSNPVGTEYYYNGNTNRVIPDMALTANPDVMGQWYYSTCCNGGGWQDEGGTSIVAPELAGFFAQENTYLNYIGNICGSDGTSACTPVGLASPFLYENGAGDTHHDPFYDMLSGCNDNDITVQYDLYYYCAYPGFDLVTGWGSANMMQLAWGINWQLIPAYGQPSISWVDQPATNYWYNTDQEISWKVTDGLSQGSGTPSGVAGFTQGWDSIPSDPFSEPHSGEGNSFYSGPQYAFGTTGCLSFTGLNGCSDGGVGQGCHTVQLEGWDNQGGTTTAAYGPVCFDNVAPTIAIDTVPSAPSSTGWFNIATGGPTVSLVATDPGGGNASGVKTIYGVVGATSCSPSDLGVCQIYGPPFGMPQGGTPITTFSEDNAGNFSSVLVEYLYVDTVAPATTLSLGGTLNGGIYQSKVTVTLSATDATSGVETTYYKLNGGAATAYSAPFTVSTLGSNTLQYWSVDWADNKESTHTATFTIHSPTSASLVATPNPALLGGSVKMTATITATISGTPTGTVTFWNGATNLGTGTLSGGVATLSTTTLPAGFNTLQVSYPATGNFLAINSAPFDETVNEHTTTTLTSSANPSPYGQAVTFTAQVAPSNSGTPTGTVGFYNGSTLMGTSSLNGSDTATFTTSSLATGTDSIKGVYSGDSTYLTSTSAVLSETVTHLAQTIDFPAIASHPALSTVTLSATASSGLAVSFTSLTTSVCTVTGNSASLLESGTCTIQASQPGNDDYLAAPRVNQSFTVTHAAQTIDFGAITSQPALSTLTLTATASSGLTVSYTSLTTSVCTVTGNTASLVESGTCTIQASQPGNDIYLAAPKVNQTFTVTHLAQTIDFAAIASQPALTTVTLSATASSGLTVSYTSLTTSVCTVSGNTASLLESGTCTIQASQPGNDVYLAAAKVSQSITVKHLAQTIDFGAITSQPVNTTVTLSATASSGLTVSYTSLTTSVCSVSGNTASLLETGTCTIQASQPGNDVYLAAPRVSQSFTVTAN